MKTYQETIDNLANEVYDLYKNDTLSYNVKPKMELIAFIFDKSFNQVYNDVEYIFQRM